MIGGSHTVLLQNFGVTNTAQNLSATEMMERTQNIFLRILCREVPLEFIQPFIRGIRWDFREIWNLTI